MYILLSILIFIVCILMILIVLVQNSKGGGLASTFSASNQIMGVRKTSDFLEKATWTLAIALLALSLLSTLVIPRNEVKNQDTELKQILEEGIKPVNYNAAPNQKDIPPADNY